MTSPSRDDIVVECDLPEAPEKVWRALTEPEIVAAWLLPNDIRSETGQRFSLGAEGRIACTVLEAEPAPPAALFLARNRRIRCGRGL
ncbi:SRPBCC domain-containing protein [Mesorhizobium sp. UC22_110]|uniref:SRPBCC family protein n=1 Tax=Mesorhizobium sp. UC22_110 TaxID=3374552 RepID=UPI003757234B